MKGLDKLVAKGKMDEAKKADILAHITFTTDLQEAADADLVGEAATETPPIKKGHLHRPGRHLQARDHPGLQHLLHLHHRDRRRHQAPRAGHRHALL